MGYNSVVDITGLSSSV